MVWLWSGSIHKELLLQRFRSVTEYHDHHQQYLTPADLLWWVRRNVLYRTDNAQFVNSIAGPVLSSFRIGKQKEAVTASAFGLQTLFCCLLILVGLPASWSYLLPLYPSLSLSSLYFLFPCLCVVPHFMYVWFACLWMFNFVLLWLPHCLSACLSACQPMSVYLSLYTCLW